MNNENAISKAYLRDAALEDVDLIYKWANDPYVRKNSFSSDEIKYEEHINWFHNFLLRKDARQYILVVDGMDVGQAKVTVADHKAEIGYSIAAEYRCRGYGKLIISLLPDIVKRDFPEVNVLVAQVKPDNIASKKVFADNQFYKKCEVYELNI